MRLLEHTRAFANFVFRPSGEQVLANGHAKERPMVSACSVAPTMLISGMV